MPGVLRSAAGFANGHRSRLHLQEAIVPVTHGAFTSAEGSFRPGGNSNKMEKALGLILKAFLTT